MINKLVELLSRRSIRIGIGLLISAVSLYLAVRDIELGDILKVLSQASWSMVVLALVSTCLNSLLKALRWKVLLLPAPVRISNTNVLMSTMVGQMFNSIFPARAGELSRVYVMGEMGVGRAFVVGTIVLEKVLDMISYTLLIFWMLIWIPHPDWLSQSGWAFAAGTFIVLTGILIFLLRKQEFMAWVDKALLKLPGRIGDIRSRAVSKGIVQFQRPGEEKQPFEPGDSYFWNLGAGSFDQYFYISGAADRPSCCWRYHRPDYLTGGNFTAGSTRKIRYI